MANIPITPLSTTERYLPSAHTQSFTADRSVTWSATGGATVAPSVGVSTVVTFPNRTQTIIVTGVSGPDSGSASLTVYGTWPVYPHLGYEVQLDNKTLVSYAEDGSAVFRRKGSTRRSWTLGFRNTTAEDWQLIREFWNFHQKDLPFYFDDLELLENVAGSEVPTTRLVTLDSGVKVTVTGPVLYDIDLVVREL